MKYSINVNECKKQHPDIKIGVNPVGVLHLYCPHNGNHEEKISTFVDTLKSNNQDLEVSTGRVLILNPGWVVCIYIKAAVEYCILDESKASPPSK